MDNPLDRRVRLLAAAWCINVFALSITYPFLPIYLHTERGYPMALVGLVFPVMGVARMLGPPLAGWLVDRFGRRPVLIGGPVARSLCFLALAWLAMIDASLPAIAALLFLGVFCGGFFQAASDAYVADITPANRAPEAFARIRVGLNIGWMIGPAVGAFLARTPFALLFGLTGGLCLVTAATGYFGCPESRTNAEPSTDGPQTGRRKALGLMLQDRTFRYHMIFAFALFLLTSQLASTLSVFATESVGISKNLLGFLYTANGLMVILFQIPIGRILARTNLGARLAAGALFYAVGYFGFGLAGAWVHLLAFVIVFTVGEILAEPAVVSVTSRLAPAGATGRYLGAHGLVRGLGYSIGPYVGALLFARFANEPLFLWTPLALCAVLAACGFAWLRTRPGFEPKEAPREDAAH